MDVPSVGHGQNEFFTFPCRAFLNQTAVIGSLSPVPPMAHGLHKLRVPDAVTRAADGRVETIRVD